MKAGFSLLLCFILNCGFAQDIKFARKMVDTLSSATFWGRGYTKDGMKKTAKFLEKELLSYGVKPMDGKSFFQEYSYPVNTFPGKMSVEINNKKLRPGKDFIVFANSKGIKASGLLQAKDSLNYADTDNSIRFILEKKLTWGVSRELADQTTVQVNKKALIETPVSYKVDIENKFVENFKTSNICGIIKGTSLPDSIIAITAHYDHLGGLGSKTYFPGANDNASGISLLLNLAKHYVTTPPAYSIAFICFSGEEAGLQGSKYFAENPLIDLKKILFLINLDLTGTGEEGITVVNGSVFKSQFSLLKEINTQKNYFNKINSRGRAANSDHYWFAQKDVPCFYIYTMGGIKAYHDVFDISKTLPLNSFENLFKLITDFNQRLIINSN